MKKIIILLLLCLVARYSDAKCGISIFANSQSLVAVPNLTVTINAGDSMMLWVSALGCNPGGYCDLDDVYYTYNGNLISPIQNDICYSSKVVYNAGTYSMHLIFDLSVNITRYITLIVNPTSIGEASLQNILNISPNPFNDKLNISFTVSKPTDLTYEIFDMYGKKLKTYSHHNFAGEFKQSETFENLSAGVYFFQLTLDGETIVRKIIHQ